MLNTRLLPAFCLLAAAIPCWAGDDLRKPLYLANKNPFIAIYGLPLAESGALMAAGQHKLQFSADIANSFRVQSKGDEDLWLDGETVTGRLAWRYGVNAHWEVGADLPLLHHGGGVLDRAIDRYHQVFGFDRAGRDEVEHNQLHYQYDKNDRTLVLVDRSGAGVGDLVLKAARSLHTTETRALAARFSLKAPTGDSDRLYGSGAWDVAAGLHWADNQSFGEKLGYELSAGVLYTGNGDVLTDQRRNTVGYGSAMLAWQVVKKAVIKIQLDMHSSFYRSGFRELDAFSGQLSIGSSIQLAPRWQMDVSFSEDIVVDTAPDIVFQFAVRYRPNAN